MMRTNRKRIAALLLALCLTLALAGCSKKAGYSEVDTGNARILVIGSYAESAQLPTVTVRRLEYDKEQETHHIAQERTAFPSSAGGRYVLTVETEGLYQVEATLDGFTTETCMVVVDKNRVYTMDLYLYPQESEAASE